MSYYLVRVGEGSKYIKEAKKGSYIAIGWNEVSDLNKFNNLDKIKSALKNTTYNYTATQHAIQAGQIYRFGLEMKEGDTVLSPLGSGEYLIGRAKNYYFENKPTDDCPYKHRRKVNWSDRTLLKEDMSTNLSYSLAATLTIFSLNKYENEIEALLLGVAPSPAEKPEKIRDIILQDLMNLDGREFEEFIKHLLEVLGFTAETTQYVGDKGIDVNGILNAEGLAEVTLKVQVKRVHGTIGNKEVLAIRGALGLSEHPCLITLSQFSSSAQQEASAPSKTPVKLIDGQDLAAIILKHFDEVGDKYKEIFNIRRKKDINIEDQFEYCDKSITEEEPEEISTIRKKIQDTIICPAKEDGFKEAFLGQKAWWAVKLSPVRIPDIKYIAIYQSAPISKITYYGEVERIEPYKDTGKYKIYLKGDTIKLKNPVKLGKNRNLCPQGIKYSKLEEILKAKTLDDIFSKN